MSKLVPILIIFAGETIAIYAEIFAAREYNNGSNSFAAVFFKVVPLIIIGAAVLLIGYMLGLAKFKNIWIVSAISVTSIFFLEPIIGYTVTGQLPTRGALLGLIFAALGFGAALFL